MESPARGEKARRSIDLSLVHLVIQLRTGEANGEKTDDRSLLLPRLERWINERLIGEKLASAAIEVLAVEPAWSKPAAARKLRHATISASWMESASLPSAPSAGNMFWDDAVKTGELLPRLGERSRRRTARHA